MSNNAPKTSWHVFQIGCHKRRRLYVDGRETPYFVDTALAAHARTYGEKHGLYGSGMHANGCAAVLGFGPHVSALKHKAEQMALGGAS